MYKLQFKQLRTNLHSYIATSCSDKKHAVTRKQRLVTLALIPHHTRSQPVVHSHIVSWSAVPHKPTSTIAYKSHLTLLYIAIPSEILLLHSETTAREAAHSRPATIGAVGRIRTCESNGRKTCRVARTLRR